MLRLRSLILKNLAVSVFAFCCVGLAHGQATPPPPTMTLQKDLNQSFKKFKVFRLDAARAAARTKAPNNGGIWPQQQQQQAIEIPSADGRTFLLDLTPRDLRAPHYRAEVTTAEGRQALTSTGAAITTFRGRVAGEANSKARLTIDGERVEGYFFSDQGKFFIEPARRYSARAAEADLVVYREEDFINPEGYFCHSQLGEKIERGKKMAADNAASVTILSPVRVLEMATEADYEFVSFHGGAAQANAEILSIMNMVEGVYESEIGLSFEIVFQHAWTTPDPFNGANSSTLLYSFKDYWNANFAQVARDAAHVWTNKPNTVSQGLAFLRVVCSNPSFAYGMSGRVEWAPAKFDITAHEVGHNLSANHADGGECANTIMNSTLMGDTPLTFCSPSRQEVISFVNGSGSCLSPRAGGGAARFDFDGDGKTDTSIFRPSNGIWAILNSSSSGSGSQFTYSIFQFGQQGDRITPADYDGDGKADAAVFRGGVWYRMRSSTSTFDGVQFGLASDVPVPADFDGDGKADVAVFRPATGQWFWLNSGGGGGSFSAVQFGAAGDVPMPADFDGDGKADVTVWRPVNGVWYRINSRDNTIFAAQFGAAGDKPVAGDFNGDGKFDLAVFRPSNGYWYASYSGSGGGGGGVMFAAQFGISSDIPAPGDFDGDGKTDLAVYRSGIWHRMTSSNSAYSAVSFGLGGDVPAPSYYLPPTP